jgi:hypothetical protein
MLVIVAATACGSGLKPNERLITAAEYGDKWPFTFDSGVLACELNAVTVRVGETVYPVNGRAMSEYRSGPALKAVTKPQSLGTPDQVVTRLSEADRRRVFAASVACEDKAEADTKNISDLMRQVEESARQAAACKTALAKSEGLATDEATLISTEGVLLGWPPLSPTYMSVGDIIADGLKLCDN